MDLFRKQKTKISNTTFVIKNLKKINKALKKIEFIGNGKTELEQN